MIHKAKGTFHFPSNQCNFIMIYFPMFLCLIHFCHHKKEPVHVGEIYKNIYTIYHHNAKCNQVTNHCPVYEYLESFIDFCVLPLAARLCSIKIITISTIA